jgi:hypothetical protein
MVPARQMRHDPRAETHATDRGKDHRRGDLALLHKEHKDGAAALTTNCGPPVAQVSDIIYREYTVSRLVQDIKLREVGGRRVSGWAIETVTCARLYVVNACSKRTDEMWELAVKPRVVHWAASTHLVGNHLNLINVDSIKPDEHAKDELGLGALVITLPAFADRE